MSEGKLRTMRARGSCLSAIAVATSVLCAASAARAEGDAVMLVRALRSAGDPPVLPEALRVPQRVDRIPLIVEHPANDDPRVAGLVPLAGGFAAGDVSVLDLEELARRHPEWRWRWSPPRRPLLDRAAPWVNVDAFRARTGGTGKNAIVGIVDTGMELGHRDLRQKDGRPRVQWLIDFSRHPAGRHPELEQRYGCTGEMACAVFDQEDLHELLNNDIPGDTPSDTFGHGTHVASLAAGNGFGNEPAQYVGIAPEAQLIVARVTRDEGAEIQDRDILVATNFIFERAADLGLPAVVNLSLGSDFGPHDGGSDLERGLAALVGPSFPGRAIVVAAGNSGGVFVGGSDGYAGPFGVHTQVHVPRASEARVPILTSPTGRDESAGTVFVWITFQPGDEVAVGLDREDGEWIRPIEPGDGTTNRDDGLKATIVNDDPASADVLPRDGNSAIVVIEGTWKSGETFALRLEGHGTAELWVQAEGRPPDVSSLAALFPRAMKQGTINVPASHPALIAVGATMNRTDWIDYTGQEVTFARNGALDPSPVDSPAFFSAAGPNSAGVLKPDIVAPGMWVAGAMSRSADPRDNPGTMFGAGGRCPGGPEDECFVLDGRHAVAMGTSMAAPIVSGAVALLLEKDPTLTQPKILALLQGGARRVQGTILVEQQAGPGALDVNGALDALNAEREAISRDPIPEESWLALASSYARPDADYPLAGYVQLRASGGAIADGFDPSRLRLVAAPALVLQRLERVAAGAWRFQVAAPPGSGGADMTLRVLFDDRPLLERMVPIAVDQALANDDYSARGGCSMPSSRKSGSAHGALLFVAASVLGRRLIRRSAQSKSSRGVARKA